MEKYIIERIKQDPFHASIVNASTPVIAFGNITNSTVATLGINPSKNEFLKNGAQLQESERRFETLNSLGATSLSTLTDNQVEKIVETCSRYFNVDNHPYKRWFNQLENYILKPLSVSYYEGTACHLDIVQWATDPIWRSLDHPTKMRLIESDISFLSKQLNGENINTLLINGREATQLFKGYFKPNIRLEKELHVDTKKCRVCEFDLKLEHKVLKVFAWSNNLQSTMGMTKKMKNEIGSWISYRQKLSHC